jgi:hypothetical protein
MVARAGFSFLCSAALTVFTTASCGKADSPTSNAGASSAQGGFSGSSHVKGGADADAGTAGVGGAGGAGKGGSDGRSGAAAGAQGGKGSAAEGPGPGGEAGDGAVSAGGAAGSGGASAAGGAGVSAAMHCQPGETRGTYPSDVVKACYDGNHRLPNAQNAMVRDFLLDAPTVSGQRFAVSTTHMGLGPFNVEIWGAKADCGVAEELLWWGPMVTGTQCGEFTPTDAYTHLLYVYRQFNDDSYGFSMPELTLCADGSCPGGPTGEGLEPGRVPTGAPFSYPDSTYKLPNGFDMRLGLYGNLLGFVEGGRAEPGAPNPLVQGVFRNATDDPFGDAWYCIGAGSTITESVPEDILSRTTYSVSLQNLTKLPSCATLSGDEQLSIYMDQAGGQITSSLSAFSGTEFSIQKANCIGTACTFRLDPSDRADGTRFGYVNVAESEAPLDPTGPPLDVNAATWFLQIGSQPITVACSISGILEHDPVDTTTISLDSVRTTTCPGEPVDVDTFEFTTIPP